jgi:hypothetical protein
VITFPDQKTGVVPVKQYELTTLLKQLEDSKQAQVTATSPTTGTIIAHHFLMPTINASYSLDVASGVLTVEANHLESEIQAELGKRLKALQSQGV